MAKNIDSGNEAQVCLVGTP